MNTVAQPAVPASDRRPPRILVVDDERSMREMLQIVLRREGYEVLLAENGRAALDMLEKEPVDLLISDIKMPGLDGYELIKTIRATPKLADIPAIALTGFGMQTDIDQLRAAGFNCCIPKPADVEDMLPLIRELTGA